MADFEAFRKMALALPEAGELPHFEKTSFRVAKKIFATWNQKENRACLKLSEVDQDVFSAFNRDLIHPVPNKWGKQGWTLFYIARLPSELISDALITAYCEVAPKKLADQVRPQQL